MASSDKHPEMELRAQGEESCLSLKVSMKSPELSVPLTGLFSKWGKGVVDKMTPEQLETISISSAKMKASNPTLVIKSSVPMRTS